MQTMALADELFPNVLSGVKRGTVRAGIRDVRLGALMFTAASGDGKTATVWVDRVAFTTEERLTDEDAVNDGYADRVELIDALHGFYPHMMASDPVTVVSFSAPVKE